MASATMTVCPFWPANEQPPLKCDYLVGKAPLFKKRYMEEFCKGRFQDCAYYFHLTKWLERIEDAMKEEEGEE